MQSENYPNAGMLRRFAAMLYDAFLVVALWMTSTTLLVSLFTDGAEAQGLWFQLFLYAELAAFYIFSAIGKRYYMDTINSFMDSN